MIGILLIFSVGKYFYQLADNYNKNKWVYAILGVISYYAGQLIGGVILGVCSMAFDIEVDWDDNVLMTVIGLPIGIATCWLFYYLLKKKWSKAVVEQDSIDDIGRSQEEI
ncbi:hypothetical protein [Flavobacterium pedocola]